MDFIELPMNLIDEDTDQPRYQFDEEALQELAKSIEELGLLSPIKVRTVEGGRYKIIYGNRRYKATQMLGRPTIPCIVSTVTDETEIYLEQIAENLTREGFSPVEEAEAFHKMMNDPRFSVSVKFVSGKLGKTENYIKNKLELLKFDVKVRMLIVSGSEIRKDKLTEEQVLPLKDLPMEHRDSLALLVARDELPVSDVKKIAKLFKDPDLSAGTKDKLLYKSGYELLQTWSTLEANRKERAKRAEEMKKAEADGDDADEEEPSNRGSAKPPSAAEGVKDSSLPAPAPVKATMIEEKLASLLASLPEEPELGTNVLKSVRDVRPEELDHFVNGVNDVIKQLGEHLEQWRKVQELLGQNN